MSSGAEHYKKAEQLLVRATDAYGVDASYFAEMAQAHATLAAAAAQVETALSIQADNGVQVEWIEAVT